jgi:hypothetical protein
LIESSRISCSQTRSGSHPFSFSASSTWRSRSRLRFIFAPQKSAFVLGHEPCVGQPCQKHPSTKTATRSRAKRKSGDPGKRSGLSNRNRNPQACRTRRNETSGAVCCRRTAPMILLRSSEGLSVMCKRAHSSRPGRLRHNRWSKFSSSPTFSLALMYC